MKIKDIFLVGGMAFIMNTTYATDNVEAVVLAAGRSKRFGKDYSKMLADIHGTPMVVHALRPLQQLDLAKIVVLGFQKDEVKEAVLDGGITNVQFVVQEQQLGTGHAVACAQHAWSKDHILITYGDMPLLKADLIEKLYAQHSQTHADITFIVAHNVDKTCSYGRIVPDKDGTIRIVEKKHFTHSEHDYPLVNAGIYLVKRDVLETCLHEITENNVTHEYYLTDIAEIAAHKKLHIQTFTVPFDAVRGINTQEEFDSVLSILAALPSQNMYLNP